MPTWGACNLVGYSYKRDFTIKKEEPAPPKKPLKKEEKEELLELPKYDNSIDLVNFIEIESTQKRIEKSKSSFILQNYKGCGYLHLLILLIHFL